MKDETSLVCPGCKKGCPAGAARCKYGQKFFEKAAHTAEKGEKKHSWRACVTQNSAIDLLISTGRSTKKALKAGETTEAQLLDSLTEAERQTLSELLERFRRKNFGPTEV